MPINISNEPDYFMLCRYFDSIDDIEHPLEELAANVLR